MQITVADAGPHRTSLTIAYDAGEVATRIGTVLSELGRQVRIDGFRPGKVSRGLLEKRYGEAARLQAHDDLKQEGLRKAIVDKKLKPVGEITTNATDTSNNSLSVTVSFEVRPAITIPAAKDLVGVDVVRAVISDAQVDEAVTAMARRAGTMQPLTADDTVLADDSLTLTGTISADGKELRKLHDFHHLVGGYPLFGKPAADVVAALAGKKIGDTLRLETVLPASFTPSEAAGKPAILEATIQNAERLHAVAITDEFAAKVGAKDVADLRARLKERLAATKDNEQRQSQLAQLNAALLASVPFELPPGMFEKAVASEKARLSAGKTGDEAAAAVADVEAMVTKELRTFLIIDALADQLDVQVTSQDIHDQIQMAAYQTGRKADAIAQHLRQSGKADQVMLEIRQAKAQEMYLDQVIAARAPASTAAAAS